IFICLGLIFILLYFYLKINKIKETTLCLIVKNDKVLMMYRNKKKNDVHINKYNGLGGKVEFGESKDQCVRREVFEEAGLIMKDYHFVGKVVFKNFGYKMGKEIMYCYVCYDYENEIIDCNEGELVWINKQDVLSLPLWEGDQYFLMNIINNEPFYGFLHYKDDKVVNHKMKRR
ncbi:MAG: hydrolase, partial [Haloplasmataceae bacterium]|nr:hydrolase [Haloplasmataceae bacterium]